MEDQNGVVLGQAIGMGQMEPMPIDSAGGYLFHPESELMRARMEPNVKMFGEPPGFLPDIRYSDETRFTLGPYRPRTYQRPPGYRQIPIGAGIDGASRMGNTVTTLGQWDTLNRYIAEFKKWCKRWFHYTEVEAESVKKWERAYLTLKVWEEAIAENPVRGATADSQRSLTEARAAVDRAIEENKADHERTLAAHTRLEEMKQILREAGCEVQVGVDDCSVECPPEPTPAPKPTVPVPTPSPYPSGPRQPFPIQVPLPGERMPQRTFQSAVMPGEAGAPFMAPDIPAGTRGGPRRPQQEGRVPMPTRGGTFGMELEIFPTTAEGLTFEEAEKLVSSGIQGASQMNGRADRNGVLLGGAIAI